MLRTEIGRTYKYCIISLIMLLLNATTLLLATLRLTSLYTPESLSLLISQILVVALLGLTIAVAVRDLKTLVDKRESLVMSRLGVAK